MRKRQRTSIIWKIDKDELEKVVISNNSFAGIIRHFGFAVASGNYKTLRKKLEYDKIDYSHIPQGLDSNKDRKFPERAIPLEEVMIENSTYSKGSLKKRLLKNGMLENKCEICGQLPEHNGQILVMILDHKNGIRNDHRRENLQMLCPNCNSQQKTFAGRNNRRKYNCSKCGKETTRKRKYCNDCHDEYRKSLGLSQRKVKDRPSKEQLIKMIEETNYCVVGKRYGVSDNCIRSWIK